MTSSMLNLKRELKIVRRYFSRNKKRLTRFPPSLNYSNIHMFTFSVNIKLPKLTKNVLKHHSLFEPNHGQNQNAYGILKLCFYFLIS